MLNISLRQMILAGLLAITLVASSVFWSTRTVHDYDDLSSLTFGFPLTFVAQDQSAYDPTFPDVRSFNSPMENPTKILWFNYWLSYIIALIVIQGFFLGIYQLLSSKYFPTFSKWICKKHKKQTTVSPKILTLILSFPLLPFLLIFILMFFLTAMGSFVNYFIAPDSNNYLHHVSDEEMKQIIENENIPTESPNLIQIPTE